jgi:hypothetical protein
MLFSRNREPHKAAALIEAAIVLPVLIPHRLGVDRRHGRN